MSDVISQFIAQNVSKKTLAKASNIYGRGYCTLKKIDHKAATAKYRVESETYFNKYYSVSIENFSDLNSLIVTCTCPAAESEAVCKHGAAALLAVSEVIAPMPTYRTSAKQTDDQATKPNNSLLTMQYIDEHVLKINLTRDDWTRARQLAYTERAKITTNPDMSVSAVVTFKGDDALVQIQKIAHKKYITSCSCADGDSKLCLHRAVVFLQLKFTKGEKAFEMMKDWTDHKNALLAEFGYSLSDDLNGKFSFIINSQDIPELKVLDPTIVKLTDLPKLINRQQTDDPVAKPLMVPRKTHQADNKPVLGKKEPKYILAYVFVFNYQFAQYPFFAVMPVTGKLNAAETKITSELTGVINQQNNIEFKHFVPIDSTDFTLFELCKKCLSGAVLEYAQKTLQIKPASSYINRYYIPSIPPDLPAEQKLALHKYIYKLAEQILILLDDKLVYLHQDAGASISTNSLKPANIIKQKATMQFKVSEAQDGVVLEAFISINGQQLSVKELSFAGNLFANYEGTIAMLNNYDHVEIYESFLKRPIISVQKSAYPALYQNVIAPLQNYFTIHNQLGDITITDLIAQPKAQIYLKEDEDYLIFQLLIEYEGKQTEPDDKPDFIYSNAQLQTLRIIRNTEFETKFKEFVLHLHPEFIEQYPDTQGYYFWLPYDVLMNGGWFLDFFEKLKEQQIEVFGFKTLTKFHFNLNKPKLSMSVSSGIDWFDVQAEVAFGDLKVSLKDVQKAIVKKDSFVKLSDGSIGLLPEEWLKKYASLFKMGEIKGKNGLQVSKFHFSVIDQLYDDINESEVLQELIEKRNKLRSFNAIEHTEVPAQIQAQLRPYQKSGLNWLNFLHEFKWGGCLADDMGLGKTLQILTFLQFVKLKDKPQIANLVVVPTSLIFNWEAEVDKFCPNLSILRYHGNERFKIDTNNFNEYDIIITTYGTLASDIELFSKRSFYYLILDESQAIKNPETKRYKAVRLLKAYNRLAMTGTPIENNTFDLYAQLNFLNPGMLGSMDFFKNQFANPIDKHNDPDRVEELKKLVFPFVLRRTKEIVAQDLPDKTETILFCQMGAQQRRVYEAFRDEYRFKIIEKINSEGMTRAGFYILEGLMKLRQICNSPALLKDAEDYGNDSIKLDQLMEHITERVGNHKVLVFSQFLGMLALIKDKLHQENIHYAYLDGSTSPAEREVAVRTFQTEKACRVFLVSLKAGGTGLNLTAADYVFLVDPWWNPAVEQQAIDRTHRIGQTNHVFAYKMICKDSVEEKILSLQQKKKALAADLISTDKGFIKNLNKSDVEFLFS